MQEKKVKVNMTKCAILLVYNRQFINLESIQNLAKDLAATLEIETLFIFHEDKNAKPFYVEKIEIKI